MILLGSIELLFSWFDLVLVDMDERDLAKSLRWAGYLGLIAFLTLPVCIGIGGAMPLSAFVVAGATGALEVGLFYAWLKTQINAVMMLPVFAVVGAWVYLSGKYSFGLAQDLQFFAVVEIASCLLLLRFRSQLLRAVARLWIRMIVAPAAMIAGLKISRGCTKQVSRPPRLTRLCPMIRFRVLRMSTTRHSLASSYHGELGMFARQ